MKPDVLEQLKNLEKENREYYDLIIILQTKLEALERKTKNLYSNEFEETLSQIMKDYHSNLFENRCDKTIHFLISYIEALHKSAIGETKDLLEIAQYHKQKAFEYKGKLLEIQNSMNASE